MNRKKLNYNNSAMPWTPIFPNLKFYSQRETVVCFDSIKNVMDTHPSLQFVFMGDSRARQLFYNFLKVYDAANSDN